MNNKSRIWYSATAAVVLIGLILNVTAAVLNTTGAYTVDHFYTGLTRGLNQFTYFSLHSNIMVGVAAVLLAVRADRTSTFFRVFWLTTLVGITVTGVVYHALLSGKYELDTMGLVANHILHTVVPILALIGWLVYGPRGFGQAKIVWLSIIFPLGFLAFALIRGTVIDWYPYFFVDPNQIGYGGVTIYCVALALFMLGLGAKLAFVERRITRRKVELQPA